MKHIDWRAAMRDETDRLSFLYHLRSANTGYSPLLQRARLKSLKGMFQRGGSEVLPGKHYFSAPTYRADEAELKFGPAIRVLLQALERRHEAETAGFGDYLTPSSELGIPSDRLVSISFYYMDLGYREETGACPILYVNADAGVLERVKSCGESEWNGLFDPQFREQLNRLEKGNIRGIIFGTANLFRSNQLFGERGYRLTLMEAGRWAERLTQEMKAEQGRMEMLPATSFIDREVNELLDLDGITDAVLISFVLWEHSRNY